MTTRGDKYTVEVAQWPEGNIYRFEVGPFESRRQAVRYAERVRPNCVVISARKHNPFPSGGGKKGHH